MPSSVTGAPDRKLSAAVVTVTGMTRGDGGGGPGDTLSQRALNRATLERQLLLRRSRLSAYQAVEHLVGMQAQVPNPPYFGLWTRLQDFRPDELSRLIFDRQVVRIVLMRGTIHLVTVGDCLALRPLTQPILDKDLYANVTYGPPIRGIDIETLVAAGRAILEEQPRTPKELGALLHQRWPDRDPGALAYAIRNRLPLVQVPPRGVWGASGQPTHTTAESWLGRPLDPDPSLEEMILRYLAAFGPAAVRDAQTWSGLTGLREVTERLRPRLRTFRDERGRELFDLPDAPRPDPDTPAPPRFLPEYENLLLSHADRTRVVRDDYRKRIATRNGVVPGTFLVGGFVRGVWRIQRERGAATLLVEPFEPLAMNDQAELADEGAKLLGFAASDAETRDLRFARAG